MDRVANDASERGTGVAAESEELIAPRGDQFELINPAHTQNLRENPNCPPDFHRDKMPFSFESSFIVATAGSTREIQRCARFSFATRRSPIPQTCLPSWKPPRWSPRAHVVQWRRCVPVEPSPTSAFSRLLIRLRRSRARSPCLRALPVASSGLRALAGHAFSLFFPIAPSHVSRRAQSSSSSSERTVFRDPPDSHSSPSPFALDGNPVLYTNRILGPQIPTGN